MMEYMCEYSIKRSLSGFSDGTNVIPTHRYFICISASMQYELNKISTLKGYVCVCCF